MSPELQWDLGPTAERDSTADVLGAPELKLRPTGTRTRSDRSDLVGICPWLHTWRRPGGAGAEAPAYRNAERVGTGQTWSDLSVASHVADVLGAPELKLRPTGTRSGSGPVRFGRILSVASHVADVLGAPELKLRPTGTRSGSGPVRFGRILVRGFTRGGRPGAPELKLRPTGTRTRSDRSDLVRSRPWLQAWRRAAIGSLRAARRAGARQASVVTASSSAVTAA